MNDTRQITVFDRALVRKHQMRAASGFANHSVLFDEAAEYLAERVGDVKRSFASILDLGARHNKLADQLLTVSDNPFIVSSASIIADEEFLPFAENSFDLVVSNLSLHWVNDLPGALAQIKYALRHDGLFLAAILGGGTLHELRGCLLDAELAITGGASPRTSPMIDLPTASGLLQRAGFDLPVVDQETITLTYPNTFSLMRDLRGMGEGNAHIHRLRHATRRGVFLEAARLYQSRFGNADGTIPATFEILFLHGWKEAKQASG
jgi:SAM-dependent methyltransferase